MASISKERLKEMEDEMDRFEQEIEDPTTAPPGGFILGAETFVNVQKALTTIRQETTRLQNRRRQHQSDSDSDDEDDDDYGDVDMRGQQQHGQKRKFPAERSQEFHDVDERSGRPQGPLGPPPPPPPMLQGARQDSYSNNMFAPPPPPPPEGPPTMSFTPYRPGEGTMQQGGPMHRPPAFMPPQLRHRPPNPPQHRPPFPRPPMRMGGPSMGMRGPQMMGGPQGPMGGPPGMRPPPPPPMMGGQGPNMGQPHHHMGMQGPPGPNQMQGPGPNQMQGPGPNQMQGPGPNQMHGPGPNQMQGPGPNQMQGPMVGGMPDPSMSQGPIMSRPAEIEKPQAVYAAAPQITVQPKKDKKKKKKKKTAEVPDGTAAPTKVSTVAEPSVAAAPSKVEDTRTVDEIIAATEKQFMNQGQGMMGNNNGNGPMGGMMPRNMHGNMMNMQGNFQGNMQQGGPMQGNFQNQGGMTQIVGAAGTSAMMVPSQVGTKKEKKKKEKKFIRLAASTTWEDPTLAEWQQGDFRMFAGDLGNEVTDETLVRAFNKYPGFLKAKVVRDRRSNKTKGYGFISFSDPIEFTRAMREMNGKYVGNRPIKLRKSAWQDRSIEVVRKKEKDKKRLGIK